MENSPFANLQARAWPKLLTAAFFFCLGFVLVGCHDDETVDPTVEIISPNDGDSLVGPKITVKVKTTNWAYADGHHASVPQGSNAPGLFKVSHGDAIEGHLHLCVSRPTAPNLCEVDADGVMMTSADGDSLVLDLPIKGSYTLIAQGATSNHASIKSMRDSVRIHVK
jgi:hypothetical protein